MKKMFCLILAVLFLMTSVAYAENAVSKYSDILSGTWQQLCYSGVTKNGMDSTTANVTEFTYPSGDMTIAWSDRSGSRDVEGYVFVTGNDSGAVYLTVIADSIEDVYACGEMTFNENGTFLVLHFADGATVWYVKD